MRRDPETGSNSWDCQKCGAQRSPDTSGYNGVYPQLTRTG
jgi:hypothetical protein